MEIQTPKVDGDRDWVEYKSFDGRYRVEQEVVEPLTKTRNPWPSFSIFKTKKPGEPNADVPVWTGSISNFRWHPNSNSAAWNEQPSGSEDKQLFAPEHMAEPLRIAGIKDAIPIKMGG